MSKIIEIDCCAVCPYDGECSIAVASFSERSRELNATPHNCPLKDSQEQGWLPIGSAPTEESKQLFVACAFNVCNGFTDGKSYTTDPWCVWRERDGGFARWPHNFKPTHWMPLPSPPEAKP